MEKVSRLPLRLLDLHNVPAVPFQIRGLVGSLLRLSVRAEETKQAMHGLSQVYTIGGNTAPAYPFLFGESDDELHPDVIPQSPGEKEGILSFVRTRLRGLLKFLHVGGAGHELEWPSHDTIRSDHAGEARRELKRMLEGDPRGVLKLIEQKVHDSDAQPLVDTRETTLTGLSLENPRQFAISWTKFGNVYRDAQPKLETWAATLTDAEEASRQFWPIIADYGLAYNLLFLSKVNDPRAGGLAATFGSAWTPDVATAQGDGRLYSIDLTVFESIEPQQADGFERFTPATLTLLVQDPQTKTLTPIAVRVSGHGGGGARVFVRGQATDGAWLYALQAAKASVAVYGIWLGHVYHWHIVTAAMQMTMYNTLPTHHAVYELAAPRSNYLISFDAVLLLLWEHMAPPTSITSARQFLDLMDTFARERDYFDDDPVTALEDLGLREEDFTVVEPWDQYGPVRHLLDLWTATQDYVSAFVEHTYADNAAVTADTALQAWIRESRDPTEGNIRGLPAMNSRDALVRVLTSLIHRITAHGTARLSRAANPGKSFVANFPPCLMESTIPEPSAEISTRELLALLPNTGVIGKMLTFFFTFSYSVPYEPFVPLDGVEDGLFFPGGPDDPRNRALIKYREAVIAVMKAADGDGAQITQWPLNIET